MNITYKEEQIKDACHSLSGGVFIMNMLFREILKDERSVGEHQEQHLLGIQKIKEAISILQKNGTRMEG